MPIRGVRQRPQCWLPILYFKSEDEGDGTHDGQIGHAYLHLDELDVDGPTREKWDGPLRRSFLDRLLGR